MIIFFDLDGTIIDVRRRWYGLHADLAKHYGLPVMNYRKYTEKKRDGISENRIMMELHKDEKLINLYCSKRLGLIERKNYLKYDRLFPGILSTVKKASERGDLVLVTLRKSKTNLMWQLDELGIKKYFKKILIADKNKGIIIKKEFPSSVLRKSIFISDSLDDYKVAKKLSMKPVVTGYGCRSENYFKENGVRKTINRINDLVEFIHKI